ncbi:MAG TPA: hypothetical protein QGI62_00315 [Anaerolineales bacterium]|jgi:hypothetical protein|nr:hypothetical protein [Anaerolineales bacterium]|tara:strand:- start:324 stop:1076 length:753 start_codon:yes stop_codon:yes gene_type:complete
MPTPFYHLVLSQEMLRDESLNADARDLLLAERPAFLFGNTAPDVQTVSGQTREQTHFFSIPKADRSPAQHVMFGKYPELADAMALPTQQAAFIAGYCVHLLLDQAWIWEVFYPVFGRKARWSDLPERLFFHNVLRAHLDRHDYARLPIDIQDTLLATCPGRWLPFVQSENLCRWRDVLAEQCAPGAAARTVEVFAERMGRQPEEFEVLLNSEDDMQAQILSRMQPRALHMFRQSALDRSIALLNHYFSGL